MSYINAVIFGVVQGITEFLPVSSSGHLVILHKFLSIPVASELSFDIILHLATLIAVLYFFRRDIVLLIKGFLAGLAGQKTKEYHLSWFIIIATIPAAVLGYLFDDLVEQKLRSELVVAAMLIFIAIIFIIVEKIKTKPQNNKEITLKRAIIIGFAQVLALIPGTSRSGITIITGLGMDLKREEAVRFSFLLSIPIIAGAAVVKIPDLFSETLVISDFIILAIAFLSAIISGIFAIKFLVNFAKNNTFVSFAIYRIILAFILLFIIL